MKVSLFGSSNGLNEAEVGSFLVNFATFSPAAMQGVTREDTAATVLSALMKDPCEHPRNWSVTPENRTSILQLLNGWIQNDQPVGSVVMAGARKCYGLNSTKIADLADYFWLKRLAAINQAVSSCYGRGLQISLILEDLGGRFIEGDSEALRLRTCAYDDSLRKLAAEICPGFVTVMKESTRLGMESDPSSFFTVARSLEERFRAYIIESEEGGLVPPTEMEDCEPCKRLESYRALQAEGWNGVIPNNQRTYYRQRAMTALGDSATADSITTSMCRYLAAAFTRSRLGLLKVAPGSPELLKLSFVPYPPGCSKGLERGRVEYLVFSRSKKSSKRCIPPWVGTGAVVQRQNGKVFGSINGVRNTNADVIGHGAVVLPSLNLPFEVLKQSD